MKKLCRTLDGKISDIDFVCAYGNIGKLHRIERRTLLN